MSVSTSIQAAIHQMVPLTETLNLHVDKADPGKVLLRLPKTGLILNHQGMFHAIALYALAEAAATALFAASFDLSKVEMITRAGSIQYKKVTTETAFGRATMDPAQIAHLQNAVLRDGRVQYTQPVQIVDADGEARCEASFEILLRRLPEPN